MKTLLTVLLTIITITASAQLSNDSLLAYYPFDGTTNDMSGNGYNGINNGATFTSNCDAVGNSAILFDGINDYINLSSFASTFRDHLDTMTIYFKFRFDKTTTNQTIISLGGDGENLQTNVFEVEHENNRMQVETEASNGTIDHFNNEYNVDSSAEQPLFDNACHEVMITLLEDTLTYYRDGTLMFKDEYVPTQTLSTNMFLGTYSGSLTSPCCYFGGLLDELQFYNRILDISETQGNTAIRSRYNALDNIDIFPNPSSGQVNLNFYEKNAERTIRLTNAFGQVLNKYDVGLVSDFQIELPQAAGLYFLEIQDGNKTGVAKVLRK